jgi:hypothetical protein
VRQAEDRKNEDPPGKAREEEYNIEGLSKTISILYNK